MARPAGIEPATPSLEGWCSIRLSYGRKKEGGAGERNRTSDLRVTSALLYQLSYTGNLINGIGVGAIRRPRFPWKTFFQTREDRIAIENSLPSDYESSEVASERYRIAGAAPGVRTRRIRFAHRCVLRLTREHALVACAFQVGTVPRKNERMAHFLQVSKQADGARDRTRTGTPMRRRILSPLCLPISPLGQREFHEQILG